MRPYFRRGRLPREETQSCGDVGAAKNTAAPARMIFPSRSRRGRHGRPAREYLSRGKRAAFYGLPHDYLPRRQPGKKLFKDFLEEKHCLCLSLQIIQNIERTTATFDIHGINAFVGHRGDQEVASLGRLPTGPAGIAYSEDQDALLRKSLHDLRRVVAI